MAVDHPNVPTLLATAREPIRKGRHRAGDPPRILVVTARLRELTRLRKRGSAPTVGTLPLERRERNAAR
jgi:hypothetical protein